MLTVKGVVLTQRQVGEQDQYIDILTDEYGVLEVLVKGAKKLTSKGGPAAQLFAYSTFCLRPAKRGYALNSAEPIRIFYGLRNSVSAVALASYFSQVIQFAVLSQACTQEIQRLFLNSLHFLSEQTHPQARIKAVFELRMASLLGFMPDVVMCRYCGNYLPAELCFSVEQGGFCCRDCLPESETYTQIIPMPAAALQAIRHVVLRDFERIFSFRLSDAGETAFRHFAEAFLLYHMDHRFPALDYYKAMAQELPGS